MQKILVMVVAVVVAGMLMSATPVAAQSFVGPANGGGWSGTISGSNFIYNGVSYPIVNGNVSFPDCTTYAVAPFGGLFYVGPTSNCTPGGGGGLITPTITWATPGWVWVGTALSGAQLNATASASGNPVAGTFVYSPPVGTVMNTAGSQTLSVTFTPADAAAYNTAAASVQLAVSAFVGPAGGGGWSGTISGSNFIYNGVSYPIVNGNVNFPDCTTYAVAPTGALFSLGVTPSCTPGGGGGPTTPTIAWATPAPVAVGTALSGTQLNATASGGGNPVAGTFVYSPPAGTVMNTAGSQTLSVTFTPAAGVNYNSATASVQLAVNGFVGPANGGGYSGTISGSNLIYNGVSYPIVNGHVSFPDCTTYSVAPTGGLFTPSATPNCSPGGGGGGGLITPTMTWATPASVAVGTALSGTQLNAAASASGSPVAGTFVYTPAGGTVMNTAGNQTLSVTFTPSNTAAYASASASVTLVVTAAGGGTFVGPTNGGGWTGTLANGVLTYNGVGYPVVNGVVTFPDCSTYFVSAAGSLFAGAPPAASCGGSGGGGGGGTPPPAGGTGQVIRTTKLVDTAAQGNLWGFDAAFDASTSRYLLIIYASSRVFGLYVGTDGLPAGSWFTILSAPVYWPKVASNGQGLFALTYTRDNGTSYTREALLVEAVPNVWASTGGVSAPFRIESGVEYSLTYAGAVKWNPVLGQFLVGWAKPTGTMPGQIGTFVTGVKADATAGLATTLVADAVPCNSSEYGIVALPEFAFAPDGTGVVAGYEDTSTPACAVAGGGIWYRMLGSDGLPIGGRQYVEGFRDATAFNLQHKVVYNSVSNGYLVVWTQRPSTTARYSILGQKLTAGGVRDGDTSVVRAPILNDSWVTNDGFGTASVAFDATLNQFEVAAKGIDINGLAPVWRFRLDGNAVRYEMDPESIGFGDINPSPVVLSDGLGHFVTFWRLQYSIIFSTLITQ